MVTLFLNKGYFLPLLGNLQQNTLKKVLLPLKTHKYIILKSNCYLISKPKKYI